MSSDSSAPEPVSILVNTLDAAKTLEFALASVKPWAGEIVVVDQGSRDETRKIAESFGARIYNLEPTGFVEPARRFAIEQANLEWSLILDADEMVPRPLADWLNSAQPRREADVWQIPRRNYIWGAEMCRTGWAPDQDAQLRFFRKGMLGASGVIHRAPPVQPGARTLRLAFDGSNALIHFNYETVSDFLLRLDRYTTAEAKTRFAEKGVSSRGRALSRAARVFRRRFFRDGGRREGWRGFYLSLCMAFYSLAIDAKVSELNEIAGNGSAAEQYRRVAENLLNEYHAP